MMKWSTNHLCFAALALAVSGFWTGQAMAAQNCITTGSAGGSAVTSCAAIVHTPFILEQRVIDTGLQREKFTFMDVPEAQRQESWPLGNPTIRACKFCLAPNRQNAARIKALKTPSAP